ncbi:MAG: hypothetical protein BWX99_02833 [Deltaproteobacteria bacterium ADurb.Bin151]|nr:MAG: hypothetical protein BWX99_02833 [Deltaproteobacteria bacterium ADurb.Bin151]
MKRLGDIRHFLEGFNRNGAALPEKGIPDLFPAGQGTCVGSHGPGPRFRQAALIDNHRLFAIDPGHQIQQETSILHTFQIHCDDPGFLIMGQVIQ